VTSDALLADEAVEEVVEAMVEAARPPSRPGLSPSRANDFLQCPQMFRFRVIDRLPEPPSPAAARGTLVHAVLEHLFDLPAVERTVEAATALLPVQWETLLERDPSIGELFAEPADLAEWLTSAEALLATYFTLEDPTRLEPRERELMVSTDLDEGGPQLRGIIDRVDVAPNGWVRVVDYKTGRSPRAGFESSALFQMRFYAYVIWRTRGVLPKRLQLEYLGDGVVLTHEPSESEMATIEARVRSIWGGIQEAARSGDWRARPSKLCDWCSFKALCPAFGGTPPEVPEGAVERSIGIVPEGAVAASIGIVPDGAGAGSTGTVPA
jgi:putative RecB family exonuclease